MVYAIIILLLIFVIYLIIRKKKSPKMVSNKMNNEKKEPRDFFEFAKGYLEPLKPYKELLIDKKEETINNLVEFLKSDYHQHRKQAAYVLGQIGEKRFVKHISNAIRIEPKIGVKEAMEAALVAIQQAPTDEGYTELQRREIIDAVYYKKPFSKPMLNQKIAEEREVNIIEAWGKAERLFQAGVAISLTGKYEKAIEYYKKALDIKTDYAEAFFGMGAAFNNLGKYDIGIKYYKKAIDIKVDYADAYFDMGHSYMEIGNIKKAIECYQKAIDINPNDAEAYFHLGRIHDKRGSNEEAIKHYKKAIEINPDYAAAYCNLGCIDLRLGNIDNGIKLLKHAARLGDKYSQDTLKELLRERQK